MFGVVSVVQFCWVFAGWCGCWLVLVGAHGAPAFWLRVRVFVSGFVGVWGRLAALLVLADHATCSSLRHPEHAHQVINNDGQSAMPRRLSDLELVTCIDQIHAA